MSGKTGDRLDLVNEIIEVAATGGMGGFRRWFASRITELRAHPALVEATYSQLRQRSLGAAFLFGYFLPRELTPNSVTTDIAQERIKNPGLWVTGVAHIRSAAILGRAQDALDSGDVLFGLQRHYCAGCSPTPVIFTSFPDFEEHLRSTKPGDEFMLLSVRELSNKGELLDPTPLAVSNYASGNRLVEVFLLKTSRPAHVETWWLGREEEDDINQFFLPDQELIAVPFRWEQEFLIDAKMPNEANAVPVGGSY